MKNESRVMGAFIAILAIVVLVAYLFFGLEDDLPKQEKPIPQLKEEAPRSLGMQGESGEYE